MPLAAEPPPPAPEDEFPDLAGEPDLREAEPTQPEAPANQAAPEPAAPPPLTSEQREQAKQMLLLTIKHAVERGEAEPLRMARKVAQERRADNLLSPSDVEAIDLMLECMDQVPDARDEARDLIEFGAATPLSESLRKACE